ncbi:Hypothetical protein PP7435_CHR4-0184 [Komagataella phaffii CBS 7435]|uniref:Uncharacterized protein n=2 Tax=Komagataella phaffii TaxID=460519 RepID=C4R8W3_KOMPG|nr:Hypothetical protein PAS_chr4_0774 [Komagataella phaffii GS115]AOA69972.1 GQ68_05142T0 [Komagataella phaffii GS115]CAH2450554.1 Hypothetical protein BQ9382_C4-0978 [Komagataella phaffii CBS 7435]CAY72038.1 Hypothetical protein PAS_chr4_0774 [Komagataella phaffii GS115]SCV12343.1 Hypothetical protein PP7435_CHR4-0184 [Komagataella phaffii CBS 7435]
MVHQVKKKFFYGFVGLVVGATLYSMFFTTFKPSSRRTISKKQSKKKDTEVVKDDIPIDIEAKPVEEMSRTELFGFLAKVSWALQSFFLFFYILLTLTVNSVDSTRLLIHRLVI